MRLFRTATGHAGAHVSGNLELCMLELYMIISAAITAVAAAGGMLLGISASWSR